MADDENTSVAQDVEVHSRRDAYPNNKSSDQDDDDSNNNNNNNKNNNKDSANNDERNSSTTNPAAGTLRHGSIGQSSSLYMGNKIRHLKKEDGTPFWRRDIQYEFLRLLFDDETPVFTRYSDGLRNVSFCDLYLDTMLKSSKISKVVKEKLQADKSTAIGMAMLCFMVNVGRMNTTLNCMSYLPFPPTFLAVKVLLLIVDLPTALVFPEMRAQLRTFHPIPSLQAHPDQRDMPKMDKQLQDAPRLKSILKGASEDNSQPNTIENIQALPVPRTNPVNLIFVLAHFAPKVSSTHFFPPRDFFDLFTRSTLSSKSRARAFLWLMWWYLESNFSREAALNNPFGPGIYDEETGDLPFKVPLFDSLTEKQADEENIDTQSEVEFGEAKNIERKRELR